MFPDTNYQKSGVEEEYLSISSEAPNEPRLESGFLVDIMIPPACLDDKGDCEHNRKPTKQVQNPV